MFGPKFKLAPQCGFSDLVDIIVEAVFKRHGLLLHDLHELVGLVGMAFLVL